MSEKKEISFVQYKYITDNKCRRLKFKTKTLVIYYGCRESKSKTKQEILKLYVYAYNLKA